MPSGQPAEARSAGEPFSQRRKSASLFSGCPSTPAATVLTHHPWQSAARDWRWLRAPFDRFGAGAAETTSSWMRARAIPRAPERRVPFIPRVSPARSGRLTPPSPPPACRQYLVWHRGRHRLHEPQPFDVTLYLLPVDAQSDHRKLLPFADQILKR